MGSRRLVGIFDREDAFLAACRAVRGRNLSIRDTYTPYAVHGLDDAAGFPRSRLAQVCFLCGAAGLGTALAFQLWATTRDWPMNIGGKSHAALPALVPITFEVTVLFAALGVVLAFLLVAGLRPGREPALPAEGVTDDRFVIVAEGSEADAEGARADLESAGAVSVALEGGVA